MNALAASSFCEPHPEVTLTTITDLNGAVLADTLPCMVWITDPNGTPSFVNRYALEYLRCPEVDLLQLDFPRARTATSRRPTSEPWRAAPTENFESEDSLIGKDGIPRTFLTRSKAWHDNNGRLLGYVGLSLPAPSDWALALLDDLPAMILELATDGRLRWANRRWLDHVQPEVGLNRDHSATWDSNTTWLEVLHPDERDEWRRIFNSISEAPVLKTVSLRDRDGCYRQHHVSITARRDPNGVHIGWSLVATSVEPVQSSSHPKPAPRTSPRPSCFATWLSWSLSLMQGLMR